MDPPDQRNWAFGRPRTHDATSDTTSTTTSGIPPTFHKFPVLPKELQDNIWRLAIRPPIPAAHFFDVSRPSVDGGDHRDRVVALSDNPEVVQTTHIVTMPRHYRPEENPSAYLLDSSLWTACHASRSAMVLWWKTYHAQLAADVDVSLSDPVVKRSSRSADADQYLMVSPVRDLICICPLYHHSIMWPDLIRDMPFAAPKGQSRRVNNLAMEVKRHLTRDLLVRSALQFRNSVSKLWLIDYRIERLPDKPRTKEFRHVFYANGRRLVEVRQEDCEWDHGPDGLDDPWHIPSALKQVEYLDRLRAGVPAIRNMTPFGILACEYDR